MKLSTNLARLTEKYGVRGTVDLCAQNGFTAIDYPAHVLEYYTQEKPNSFYTELRSYIEDKGITVDQAHLPFASALYNEDFFEELLGKIIESLHTCHLLGVKYAVTHPPKVHHFAKDGDVDGMLAHNVAYFNRLRPYLEEYGICLAIENAGKYSTSETPDIFNRLLDELGNEPYVACVDTGHFNFSGVLPQDGIRTVGSRIKCLHVHDNNGLKDMHTIPSQGTIDWEETMKALADIGYEGNLSFEAAGFYKKFPEPLNKTAFSLTADMGRHLISRFKHYSTIR